MNEKEPMGEITEEEYRKLGEIVGKGNPDLILLGEDYEEPEYTLFSGTVGGFPKGNISAVTAAAKSGKTQLCAILAASFVGSNSFGFKAADKAKVLYIDTEQERADTARLTAKIHILAGFFPKAYDPHVNVLSLRQYEDSVRREKTLEAIKSFRPTNVIIDGIVDLCYDFNNLQQSTEFINTLMAWSVEYECNITCVLHINGNDDGSGKMRGHLGTILTNKAAEVWMVNKKDDVFKVNSQYSRHIPFAPFEFLLNEHGIPVPHVPEDRDKAVVRELYGADIELSYSDFTVRIECAQNVSERTAKQRISEYVKRKFVVKTFNTDGEVVYKLNL